MSVDPLPDNVRAFITEHIRSVRALELLLLVQSEPIRDWSAQELSMELRANPQWAAEELQFFAVCGLLAKQDGSVSRFRYAPRSPALEGAVAALKELFPARQFAVIDAIFSAPSESIRRFADAFRLRKEKPDG